MGRPLGDGADPGGLGPFGPGRCAAGGEVSDAASRRSPGRMIGGLRAGRGVKRRRRRMRRREGAAPGGLRAVLRVPRPGESAAQEAVAEQLVERLVERLVEHRGTGGSAPEAPPIRRVGARRPRTHGSAWCDGEGYCKRWAASRPTISVGPPPRSPASAPDPRRSARAGPAQAARRRRRISWRRLAPGARKKRRCSSIRARSWGRRSRWAHQASARAPASR